MSIDFAAEISTTLQLPVPGVTQTLALLDDEATIPFIARYRKEATGNLDEVQIGAVRDRYEYLKKLADRRETVLKTIADLGQLTDELREKIMRTRDAAELEDLYLPYKPKRKTRASQAIESGLEPLADLIWAQNALDASPEEIAARFVNPEKNVADAAAAWQGARDIVAERINLDPEIRNQLRAMFQRAGVVVSSVKKDKEKAGAKFRDYFDFSEAVKDIPSHRMLAIRRGEAEGFLSYRVVVEREKAVEIIQRRVVTNENAPLLDQLTLAIGDAYDRLLLPSIEGHIRNELRQRADKDAILVFARNLRRLLMAPPLGGKWVLGVDPGLRTGCKLVALDGRGELLASTTIYPEKGEQSRAEAADTIERYCQRYQIQSIAIGNGTGGREIETFIRQMGRDRLNDAQIVLVSEAGASVYSASDTARQELPDLDVTLRGAVSIGRRLQDPLAELVKIEPKAIGVGQYQHDVDQDQLKGALDETVESCVNAVGVDLNLASPQLLSYISGLNPSRAQAIVRHRSKNGVFRNRQELLQVANIGPKTYTLAAGFLRIRGGENPLDASAVHPERYELVESIAKDLGASPLELLSNDELRGKIDIQKYVTPDVGLPTLQDILAELAKPGRDPREKLKPVQFDPEVTEITHLKEGAVMEGVVTNVTDFGAFVDVGVHQDGLVHVSELTWDFANEASKVVAVGQHVKVKVIGVDLERKRISLSIKQTTEAPPRPKQPPRTPARREERPRSERPPRQEPRRQGAERERDGQRPPAGRPDRAQARGFKTAKPRHDSPFSVLFMENGVLKMHEDSKKGKQVKENDKNKKK